MKIALCILTKNEKPCLEVMMPRILEQKDKGGYDCIYGIDGGSTDGTLEVYAEYNIPVLQQSTKGRGQAFHTAFSEIDADSFVFFSPDGNEDPNDLPKFRKYLSQGYDLVIASRMMKESHNEEDNNLFRWRKWANNAFNLFANWIFNRGNFVYDSINGYRALSKEAATKLNLDAWDYTIEYQMTIRSMKLGLRIHEFATYEGERIAGETGAPSFSTGLKFIGRLFREIVLFLSESSLSKEVKKIPK